MVQCGLLYVLMHSFSMVGSSNMKVSPKRLCNVYHRDFLPKVYAPPYIITYKRAITQELVVDSKLLVSVRQVGTRSAYTYRTTNDFYITPKRYLCVRIFRVCGVDKCTLANKPHGLLRVCVQFGFIFLFRSISLSPVDLTHI